MSEFVIYALVLVSGVLIGFFTGGYIAKLKSEKQKVSLEERVRLLDKMKKETQDGLIILQKTLKDNQYEKEQLLAKNADQSANLKNLQLKLEDNKREVEKLQEKFTVAFENLANKILEEKATKFTAQNKENLQTILNPLREKIKDFEDKVAKTHKESIDYHSALRQQILQLKDLNLQMSKEAINLTKALKGDNKAQGDWGELILERVLEKSGLVKGREYDMQQSFTNEQGKRIRPDAVIHLPNNKKIIIDAKVSLTAYEQFVNADDEAEKNRFLKEHITSLKRHIHQLSEKKYETIYQVKSPDFVLLFIPIEPAFAVALNSDNTLYGNAFEKNIVMVTPTLLLATLKTISTMWNNEKQQKNALEIAKQAGRLYDQFVNLTEDLTKIGNQLKTVQRSHDSAMKKLTGRDNLIRKVKRLEELGIHSNKKFNDELMESSRE